MIDERQQEYAALHALGLLEGAEKTAFEQSLAADPRLQALVRELRESAAHLAHAAAPSAPPDRLRSRVLASIAAHRGPDAQAVEPTTSRGRGALLRWLPWALAAGFVVSCGSLGQLYLASRSESALLRNERALAELELRGTRQQLEAERILNQRQIADAAAQLAERERQIAGLRERVDALAGASAEANRAFAELREQLTAADTQIGELRERLRVEGDLAQFKIATLASLAGNSPEALAVAVWNPSTQEGILRVSKLPALATDKDYQLWVIDPAYPNPVDGGVFTVDPATGAARIQFRPNQTVRNATKFAVSLERKGGVPKAEGPIVLLGD